jgi:hypothetical protein
LLVNVIGDSVARFDLTVDTSDYLSVLFIFQPSLQAIRCRFSNLSMLDSGINVAASVQSNLRRRIAIGFQRSAYQTAPSPSASDVFVDGLSGGYDDS